MSLVSLEFMLQGIHHAYTRFYGIGGENGENRTFEHFVSRFKPCDALGGGKSGFLFEPLLGLVYLLNSQKCAAPGYVANMPIDIGSPDRYLIKFLGLKDQYYLVFNIHPFWPEQMKKNRILQLFADIGALGYETSMIKFAACTWPRIYIHLVAYPMSNYVQDV